MTEFEEALASFEIDLERADLDFASFTAERPEDQDVREVAGDAPVEFFALAARGDLALELRTLVNRHLSESKGSGFQRRTP